MAFTIYRTRAVGTKIFEFIGTLPLAFPPLVLSVGLVIIFIGTPLYNSLWALGHWACLSPISRTRFATLRAPS